MVQIGNIHVGKADTAKPPVVTLAEAAVIWDMLAARYKCIEETNIYHNYAHDSEFRTTISKLGLTLVKRQAEELEKQCSIYNIPLPKQPPKDVTQKVDSINFNDEYIFRQIFEGCQHFLVSIASAIKTITSNDPLRQIFVQFFTEEVDVFENLCKYGKIKGWLQVPPVYQTS